MFMYSKDFYEFETKCSVTKLPNDLIIVDYPKKDNLYELKFLALGPRFDIVSEALEDSTFINHITGKPFVRTSILYRKIFMSAIHSVQFPENLNIQPIIVNQTDINSMNYNLIKIICKEWLKKVI